MDYFELTYRTIPDILFNEKHYVAKWHTHYETIYKTKETSRQYFEFKWVHIIVYKCKEEYFEN